MNTNVEYLAFEVNVDGNQEKKPALTILNGYSKKDALDACVRRGLINFNLIERADSAEGTSEQRVAVVREGKLFWRAK